MPRFQVKLEDTNNRLVPFQLGTDDKGNPLWTSHLLPPVQVSVYSQSEEARYANLLPGVGSVYAQDDLSGGLGKRDQVRHEDPQSDRYYYTEWLDLSVKGQGQKGPAVTTLSVPANSGPMSGFFTLAGVPYLVLGRKIVSWASDALTQVHDYGSGVAGGQAAVFSKMSAEGTLESNFVTSTVSTLTSADDRLAQSFRLDDSGVRFLSSVTLLLTRTGALVGDVRLSIMADLNGAPSNQIITSASMLATQIPTSATDTVFRFDDDATLVLPYNLPFWLVLDCPGATAAITLAWSRTNGGADVYTGGKAVASLNRGNVWTDIVAPSDFYFILKGKLDTTAAFVGTSTDGQAFKTTTDGVTFTPDAARFSTYFTVAGSTLVRSIQTHAAGEGGLLETSTDGTNWSSDAIVVGDPSVPITYLLTLGDVVIVCKEDGIYAVDITAVPSDVQALYGGSRAATNGAGSCVWRGAAYIPFNGRLMAIQGDFGSGFTVYESVGIESLPEWDWPWGTGRHVACAGSRFHLYSIVSTGAGLHRLLKSPNPLRKKQDGTADPQWHGSLAAFGGGAQVVNMLAVYDPGGTGSPQLFCNTASNNIARIQLPRSFNPASDSTYTYDTSTPADLYFPYANGNYPVHPKSWLIESVTFQAATPGDYTEALYDNLNGEGWRRMPRGGRLYDTGTLPYPRGLRSLLLARRLRLINSLATISPRLGAFATSYAMRHISGGAMREFSFTVVAENGLGAADLGELLGIGADRQRGFLSEAAGGGLGTRRLEDPYGRVYEQVLFLDAVEVLGQTGQDGGRTMIQVNAVGVGV